MSLEIGEGLPDGWTISPIRDLLDSLPDGNLVHQGWSPQCLKESAPINEWGVLKTTAIQDGFFLEEQNKRLPKELEPKTRLEVKTGDILITCAGPRVRCGVPTLVRKTRAKLLISGKMYRMRPHPKLAHPIYVEAFLRSSETQNIIDSMKTGISESGMNITHQRFGTLDVPLPPLAEQIRIADKLDALLSRVEAGRERLERVPKLLKRFRQSVLSAAVSGELTREWREQSENTSFKSHLNSIISEHRVAWVDNNRRGKYSFPAGPKTEELSEIPETWIWANIDQIAQLVTDGDHNPPKRVEAGIPHLTAKNINNWRINLKGCTYISENDFEIVKKRYLPEAGDLIITCVGTIGRTAIIPEDMIFSPDRNLAAVRVIAKLIYAAFLQLVINTPYNQNVILNSSGSTAQPHLYLGDIRSLPIQLPPLPEQAEIVRRVEALFAIADRLESRHRAASTHFQRLTPALLAKAFRGELVEQDPADEPASVLLERIRAQRAAAGPAAKAGGRGRRPKVPTPGAERGAVMGETQEPQSEPRRGRGRPRKAAAEAGQVQAAAVPTAGSYEEAVRLLQERGQARAEGARQAELFGEEVGP